MILEKEFRQHSISSNFIFFWAKLSCRTKKSTSTNLFENNKNINIAFHQQWKQTLFAQLIVNARTSSSVLPWCCCTFAIKLVFKIHKLLWISLLQIYSEEIDLGLKIAHYWTPKQKSFDIYADLLTDMKSHEEFQNLLKHSWSPIPFVYHESFLFRVQDTYTNTKCTMLNGDFAFPGTNNTD